MDVFIASTESGFWEVYVTGPGFKPEGIRYVFATDVMARGFVQALNFAYEQGFSAERHPVAATYST